MLKKVLLLSLFLSVSFANYIEEFNNKNYKEALRLAQIECKKSCDNEILNKIIAKSAYKLNKTDIALAAYERVLIADDEDYETRMAIAEIYYQNGNKELMKNELNYMLENLHLTKFQEEKIKSMLSTINQNQNEDKKLDLGLRIGIGHETNPKLNPEKKESSVSNIIDFDGSYRIVSKDKMDVDVFWEFFNKNYAENKKNGFINFSVFSTGIRPKYSFKDSTIGLELSSDFIFYNQEKAYTNLNLGIFYYFDVNDYYSIYAGYTYTKEIGSNGNSDTFYHVFELKHTFYLNDNQFYLDMSYYKEKANPDPFNYYQFELGAYIPLVNKFAIEPSFNIIFEKNGLIKNTNFEISNSLIYEINNNNSIELELSYYKAKNKIVKANSFSTFLYYKYSF